MHMHNLTKIIHMKVQRLSPGWLVRLSYHFPGIFRLSPSASVGVRERRYRHENQLCVLNNLYDV